MAYLPITDHGLIGDLHTAALVGFDGRIVWLPWPRFDSPAIFAALLDHQRGGDWLLAPEEVTAVQQRYVGETAILLTEFEAAGGRAELRDWMSPWADSAPGHDLCRLLRCTEGEITVVGRFAPRPDYARSPVALNAHADGLNFTAHGLAFHLASNQPWSIAGDTATLQVTLRQGDEVACVLSSGQPVELQAIAADQERTRRFWEEWIARCDYRGRWAEAVRRSAITLKLLTYAPNGAIIAAPTTSLPEWIGGVRNWDYRYTWLRDASFALYPLYRLGYRSEAKAFFTWLGDLAQRESVPLQIMYGIGGEAELTEIELDHLEGYRGSRPVRIGNHAYTQRQLDVYGGVIDAAYLYEREGDLLTLDHWRALRAEIDYVCAHWTEPDQGIWEMRGPPQHHTFSKLMCWMTLDRGIRMAEDEGWNYDRPRWTATRDAIREDILARAWNEEVGAFTMAYDMPDLDASVLVMPLVGFLPPNDPRIVATIAKIQADLSEGALVYRYHSDDHLPGEEGAFLLCSFWLVDALAMLGRMDEAIANFEQLVSYAGCHGLLSEEVDPATGEALGNYPQAFSHLGLINSALNLTHALEHDSVPPAPGTAEQIAE